MVALADSLCVSAICVHVSPLQHTPLPLLETWQLGRAERAEEGGGEEGGQQLNFERVALN